MLSGITSPWEICYTQTEVTHIVLILSFMKFISSELVGNEFKGVMPMMISNFTSALIETLWSMSISFVVGISISPRAYIS